MYYSAVASSEVLDQLNVTQNSSQGDVGKLTFTGWCSMLNLLFFIAISK